MKIKTLKSKMIFSVVSVILVCGFLAAFWVASFTSKTLLNQKKDEVALDLTNISDQIKGALDAEYEIAEHIAHDQIIIDALAGELDLNQEGAVASFLKGLKIKRNHSDVLVYNLNGDVLTATDDMYLGHNFGYRNYFKKAMQNGSASEMVINGVTNEVSIIFAHRISDSEGSTLGLIVTVTKPSMIEELLVGDMRKESAMSEMEMPEKTKMHTHMLVDDNGVVVISDDSEYVFKSVGRLDDNLLGSINEDKRYGDRAIMPLQYDVLLGAIMEDSSVKVYDFYDKKDKVDELLGIAPVHNYPFYIAMEFRERDFLSQISSLYFSLATVILLACFVATFLLYYLLNRFLRPLQQLKNAAEKINKNDFSYKLSIKSGDELEDLAVAFNEMGVGLMKSKKEIEEKVSKQTDEILNKQVELEKQQKAVINILEDITEEKNISETLANDLEKFKLAIENANDQIVITDENGKIIYANSAMTRVTGFTLKEAIGNTPALWGKQMGQKYYEKMWKKIKTTKEVYSGEINNRHKNGTIFLAFVHISPILDKSGEVKFFVGVVRDISRERAVQFQLKKDAEELKKANALIENQKERVEGILGFLKSIGDGVLATDLDGKIIFFNEAAEKITGVSVEEAMGKIASDVLLVFEEKNIREQYFITRNALSGKLTVKNSNEHFLAKRKDGSFVAVSFSASLIYDKQKNKQGCIIVLRNVSEQRDIEKTKDDFLSIAAHQLRTPLTGIRWSLEMLLDGDLGKLSKDATKTLQQIMENNQRLILLVNDLLDVSRINMGKATEEATKREVVYSVNKAIDTLAAFANERGVKVVSKNSEKGDIFVNIGHKHFFQALENLISNAIKYTPRGGKVVAGIAVKGGKVIISISDNGIGIPAKEQESIFGKFFRATNAVTKDTEGSGLGLNVVKSFIEEAGGRVWFESQEGKGTTFFIELAIV